MTQRSPLIHSGNLEADALAGRVAIVTGAGRGIGFEAARSLALLGAHVVIAEVDRRTGPEAARRIAAECGAGSATFVRTDVGSERSVHRLARRVLGSQGRVDVVVNNATLTPMGAVPDVPIGKWDASYRVNLRGPVLLAQALLPGMVKRGSGVFVCVSSVGEAYMGAYETFKAAQVHLGHTLAAELEGSGVVAFTVGPGLVRTPGAEAGIAALAPLYGKSVEEFYAMSADQIISVEEAGAGFAAAVALAERFQGQEIGSRQALIAAGIPLSEEGASGATLSEEERAAALALCREVRATLAEQAAGWQERPLFERQWVIRDFQRQAGMPVARWLEALEALEQALQHGTPLPVLEVPVSKLAGYYAHLQDLARGYVKDPEKLQEQLPIIQGWQESAEALDALLQNR
ncbi:MAG: SDR family NAD(P)-dependent oxidoreductase [Anaerolineales bacterium]